MDEVIIEYDKDRLQDLPKAMFPIQFDQAICSITFLQNAGVM